MKEAERTLTNSKVGKPVGLEKAKAKHKQVMVCQQREKEKEKIELTSRI